MKRITLLVIGAHMIVLLWMALWMPVKRHEKKPLVIRTIVQAPPPPALEVKSAPVVKKVVAKKPPAKKKPIPKKKVATKAPAKKKPIVAKKKPTVSPNLIRQLQESIAKIEEKGHKESDRAALNAPKMISSLKIDEGSMAKASNYAASLIQCLQNALDLPEMGAVKIELTLNRNGSFSGMKVLKSASTRNQSFLQQELQTLKYPAFSGSLKNEKEHAFVLTFCNE